MEFKIGDEVRLKELSELDDLDTLFIERQRELLQQFRGMSFEVIGVDYDFIIFNVNGRRREYYPSRFILNTEGAPYAQVIRKIHEMKQRRKDLGYAF